MAATPGIALMRLWERLAHAFGRGADRERAAAERILFEADFGVEATEAILAHVSRASGGDFRAALEHAVTAALAADPAPGDPGALARAPTPPTVILVLGVNGVGKTTTVAKQQPGAPHESLLVLDGTVGQNAVQQARAFAAAVPLSGLVVTKLDGTAKGGSVVALERAVRVPLRFLGTGEALGDLEVFDAARYARRLVDAS